MHRLSLATCVAFLCVGCIFEQERPQVQVGALISTAFVRRGMVQNERGVIQPEINVDARTIDGGILTGNAWANLDLTNSTGDAWLPDGAALDASAVDLKAQYSRTVGNFALAAGVLQYVLPNGSQFPNGPRGTTSEVFVSGSTTLFGDEVYSFVPVASVHYDVDESEGWYLNGGIRKDLPLPWIDALRSDISATVGWSSDKHSLWAYGLEESGFADFQGGLRLHYDLNENTTVSAGVAGSVLIDQDLRDWVELIDISEDNVWVWLGMTWSWS